MCMYAVNSHVLHRMQQVVGVVSQRQNSEEACGKALVAYSLESNPDIQNEQSKDARSKER